MDYGSYAIPLGSVPDWDPNNTYDGNPYVNDPLHGYAGYGPSGGAAATATPTGAFIARNNGNPPDTTTRNYEGPASYTSSGGPSAPQQNPYDAGIDGLYDHVDKQSIGYDAQLQPYTTAAWNNYTGGIGQRQGILDQQSGALGQFAQADAGIYNQFGQTNAGLDSAGNNIVGWAAGQYGQANTLDAQNVGQLGGSLSQANYLDQQNIGQLGSSLGQANSLDSQNVAELGSSLGQSTALGQQSYNGLVGLSGQMQQLQAGGYGADVTSDPNDVARQQSAYDTLGGFANGDYAYTSQAANAYADPEALAAQKEVMGKLKGEMDPRLTDAERYLYMQARLQEEQSQRGNRDANMRELERSGMSGSTMQLSNLNASSQQTATSRAVADLGANAKAIDRAEAATRDYGNMANTVSGQSFQQAYARGQATDTASQFNTATRLQGTVAQGNLATQMRTADDSLSEFNKAQSLQQQRFQDSYAADQQAQAWGRGVDVSNAGFNQANLVSRNASIKSDAGFNQSRDLSNNAGILSNAGFQQSRDLSTNAGILSNAQFTQSGNLSRNATALTGEQLTNIGQQGQRASDLARTGAQMNSDWLTGTQNFGNMGLQAARDNTSALGTASDTAFRQTSTDLLTDQAKNALLQKKIDNAAEDTRSAAAEKAASTEADKARKAAEEDAAGQGILGTPILSKKDPLSPFNWFRGKLGA